MIGTPAAWGSMGRGDFEMIKKTKHLLVRTDKQEHAAFVLSAQINGINLSSWVRERLRRAAIADLEARNLPIAFLNGVGLDEGVSNHGEEV